MNLQTIFERTVFSVDSQSIHDILSDITLVDFTRSRQGKTQTFHFTFQYQQHTYILHHSFLFKWEKIVHSFSFTSPFFSQPPFNLADYQLELLSDEFMRSVNQWTRANSGSAN